MTTHSHCAWTNEGGHVKAISFLRGLGHDCKHLQSLSRPYIAWIASEPMQVFTFGR
jgi:hypothetical protein